MDDPDITQLVRKNLPAPSKPVGGRAPPQLPPPRDDDADYYGPHGNTPWTTIFYAALSAIVVLPLVGAATGCALAVPAGWPSSIAIGGGFIVGLLAAALIILWFKPPHAIPLAIGGTLMAFSVGIGAIITRMFMPERIEVTISERGMPVAGTVADLGTANMSNPIIVVAVIAALVAVVGMGFRFAFLIFREKQRARTKQFEGE